MEIWKEISLHVPSYDGYKAKRETPFVVPHEDSRPLTDLFARQIGDWLDRRRACLLKTGARFPEVEDLLDCVSRVIRDPRAIGLSGGELLEPVLDAILLLLADKSNPELNRLQIAEQAGLSASARKYTRRVHTLLPNEEG